jgi:hypothetical protein
MELAKIMCRMADLVLVTSTLEFGGGYGGQEHTTFWQGALAKRGR